MAIGADCTSVTFGNATVYVAPASMPSNTTVHMTMGDTNATCAAAAEVPCVIGACCDVVTIGEAVFQYKVVLDTDSASSMTSFTMLSALFAVVAALFAF